MGITTGRGCSRAALPGRLETATNQAMTTESSAKASLPLAIQLYSVRSLMQEKFRETLLALADIGFDSIEWSGAYGGMTPSQLAEFLRQAGLRVSGMFANAPGLLDAGSPVYAFARVLKPEYLAVSLNFAPDNFKEVLGKLRSIKKTAAGQGFDLTYHNHANEFQKLPDGRMILEALLEETAGDGQQFLFDTFFAYYAGCDPCAHLRKYTGRIPQIHFNDMDPAGHSSPPPAGNSQEFSTELGAGIMDLPAIYRTAAGAGVRWLVLEQHSQRDNPLDSARRNFAYCRKMMLNAEDEMLAGN